jgi:hypothetical protein
VTLFDFDDLFVCSYDLQIGIWPNLSKNHQILYFSHGDILVRYFHSILQIKAILMFLSQS